MESNVNENIVVTKLSKFSIYTQDQDPPLTQEDEMVEEDSLFGYKGKSLPNLDMDIALSIIKKKKKQYSEQNKCFVTIGDANAFTVDNLKRFHSTFRDLKTQEQSSLFDSLKSLLESLQIALASCLHYAIFTYLINDRGQFSKLSKPIGLKQPFIKPNLLVGTNGYWLIFNPLVRATACREFDELSIDYENKVKGKLVEKLAEDASLNFDAFIASYHGRFSSTIDHCGWFALATSDTIAENRTMGTEQKEINDWCSQFRYSLKEMFDGIVDYLIVYAEPYALHSNRLLLREVFYNVDHDNILELNVFIPHFDITLELVKDKLLAGVLESSQTEKVDTVTLEKRPLSPSSTSSNSTTKAVKVSLNDMTSTRVQAPAIAASSSVPAASNEAPATATTKSATPNPKNACWFDRWGCRKKGCTNGPHPNTTTLICERVSNARLPCPGIGFCLMRHVDNGKATSSSTKGTKQKVSDDTLYPTSINHDPSLSRTGCVRSESLRHSKRPATETRTHLLRLLCKDVVNVGVNVLHDCFINTEERLVLSLGLNFVPPPRKRKLFLLSEAMAGYTRRVRIKKHFAVFQEDNTIDNSVESLLHLRINKSLSVEEAKANFTPITTKSPIEAYLKQATSNILDEGAKDASSSHVQRKMCSVFYDVTSKLKARKDIIIYPADKNLGITVMNRQWYIDTATSDKYLGDVNTYTKMISPPEIKPLINELDSICKEQCWLSHSKLARLYKDLISDYTREKVQLCRMYFMPKLHKPTLSLRPICASINWITYWTSVYLHLLIFPLLKLIPSYITNSAQLVAMLDHINPPQHFQFVEADVDNLYPTINIDDGLDAMYIFLTERSKYRKSQIDFIIKLLKWVLKNNYVAFGDNTYLQISGTAMGTPCAVVFACVYMHILEQEALDIFAYQRYIVRCIFLFIRFIDDIIAIVVDHESGQFLMELLNSRRKSIKLTFKIRNLESQFLDLTLYKTKAHGLAVRAYSKPMNKFLFLPPTSCHPRHIFNGWIAGYGRRLRINCSDDCDYNNSLKDFKDRLLSRGYPDSLMNKALSAIPDRKTLLTTINKPNSQHDKRTNIGIPFVVTYSPAISATIPMLKQALAYTDTAHLDPHFPQIFGATTTPLLSFKRGKNLRDLVCSSSLSK